MSPFVPLYLVAAGPFVFPATFLGLGLLSIALAGVGDQTRGAVRRAAYAGSALIAAGLAAVDVALFAL